MKLNEYLETISGNFKVGCKDGTGFMFCGNKEQWEKDYKQINNEVYETEERRVQSLKESIPVKRKEYGKDSDKYQRAVAEYRKHNGLHENHIPFSNREIVDCYTGISETKPCKIILVTGYDFGKYWTLKEYAKKNTYIKGEKMNGRYGENIILLAGAILGQELDRYREAYFDYQFYKRIGRIECMERAKQAMEESMRYLHSTEADIYSLGRSELFTHNEIIRTARDARWQFLDKDGIRIFQTRYMGKMAKYSGISEETLSKMKDGEKTEIKDGTVLRSERDYWS